MSFGRRLTALAVLVAYLPLSACGAADEIPAELPRTVVPAPSRSVSETVTKITSSKQISLPMAKYMQKQKEYDTVIQAYEHLIDQCSRRFGTMYTANAVDHDVWLDRYWDRRYGIINRDEVARYGYEAPPGWSGGESGAKWDPSPEEQAVVTGKTDRPIHDRNGNDLPEDGCSGEASRELDGSVVADIRLPEELANIAFERAKKDSLVRHAFSKWSSCMRQHGYTYSGPEAATQDVAMNKKKRFAMAQVDRACRERENTVGVWMSIESAYQKQLIEANSKGLKAVRDLLDTRLRTAQKVLGKR